MPGQWITPLLQQLPRGGVARRRARRKWGSRGLAEPGLAGRGREDGGLTWSTLELLTAAPASLRTSYFDTAGTTPSADNYPVFVVPLLRCLSNATAECSSEAVSVYEPWSPQNCRWMALSLQPRVALVVVVPHQRHRAYLSWNADLITVVMNRNAK